LAYRYAPAAGVSIYSHTVIIFAALLGLIFWSEVPDLWSLVGGVLIIAGGALAFDAERPRRSELEK
jgi:drug/metabolite transporter (DMT)-like permease